MQDWESWPKTKPLTKFMTKDQRPIGSGYDFEFPSEKLSTRKDKLGYSGFMQCEQPTFEEGELEALFNPPVR